jgi:hypothetical protein
MARLKLALEHSAARRNQQAAHKKAQKGTGQIFAVNENDFHFHLDAVPSVLNNYLRSQK